MADTRFHAAASPHSVAELGYRSGAMVEGDRDRVLRGVATLRDAGPEDLSFFENSAYREDFVGSHAGAICVRSEHVADAPAGTALLISPNPYRAYALSAAALFPMPVPRPGISPAAHVDPMAKLGEDCTVEAGAVLGAGVQLGPRCFVGANAVLRAGVTLGAGSRVEAGACVSHTVAGVGVHIGPGSCVGQEGFGFVPDPAGYVPIPQLGRVILGDGVDIGAACTVDRGAAGDTVIGEGSRLDNMVHIAHNVRLGRRCILAGQSGVAGSAVLGDYVQMGGQAGVSSHTRVGNGARVAAGGGVIRDVPERVTVGGYPAVPARTWHRQTAALRRLADARSGAANG